MMPGVGLLETVLLVLVAIIVIGPKDLPLMMRKFGRFTGKMRALAFEFKQGFDELGRQAELEELRKEVADLKKHTGMEDLQKEFEQDQINLAKDVDSALSPASTSPAALPPAPAHPAGAANGAAQPPAPAAPPYAGLSADHPGYDTGEGAAAPEPPPAGVSLPHPHPESARSAEPKDEPVKQDTPA
jgi:sec-independent protein translocase protein TatB